MDKGVRFVQDKLAKHLANKQVVDTKIADRHYEDMDNDKLLKNHTFLYNSLTKEIVKGSCDVVVNDIKREILNELLEYERELAFREVLK